MRPSVRDLVEKLAGVLRTAGLMVGGLFGLGLLDAWIGRRDATFLVSEDVNAACSDQGAGALNFGSARTTSAGRPVMSPVRR